MLTFAPCRPRIVNLGFMLGLWLALLLPLLPAPAWAAANSSTTGFRITTVTDSERPCQDADFGGGSSRSAASSATRSTPSSNTRSTATSSRTTRSTVTQECGTPPPDLQRIRDRGKLVVAVLGVDNPPFFMTQADGRLSGLDIELAKALAQQLEVDLEINRSAETFDQVVDQVYHMEADLAISKISRTLIRGQRVRFSRPYLSMRQGLLVNRLQLAQQSQNRRTTEAIRTLAGPVGVIQNSSYVGFLRQKFPQATVVEMPTWEEAVQAVSRGDVLAAYRDELEVKKVMLVQPDASLNLQTVALTDAQDYLAMVLPWDSTHLLSWVDLYLETQGRTYTVDTVLEDYADYWSEPAGS